MPNLTYWLGHRSEYAKRKDPEDEQSNEQNKEPYQPIVMVMGFLDLFCWQIQYDRHQVENSYNSPHQYVILLML